MDIQLSNLDRKVLESKLLYVGRTLYSFAKDRDEDAIITLTFDRDELMALGAMIDLYVAQKRGGTPS